MRNRRFLTLIALALLLLVQAAIVGAQEPAKKKRKLPQSGKLAGSLTSGFDSKAVDYPWGMGSMNVEDAPPITGSISKMSERQWVMRVFNNTEDEYSVDLEVEQYGGRDNKLKSDYYSYTLRPKGSAERLVPVASNVSQCVLNLRSWKNLSERRKASETPGAATTPGAVKK